MALPARVDLSSGQESRNRKSVTAHGSVPATTTPNLASRDANVSRELLPGTRIKQRKKTLDDLVLGAALANEDDCRTFLQIFNGLPASRLGEIRTFDGEELK